MHVGGPFHSKSDLLNPSQFWKTFVCDLFGVPHHNWMTLEIEKGEDRAVGCTGRSKGEAIGGENCASCRAESCQERIQAKDNAVAVLSERVM